MSFETSHVPLVNANDLELVLNAWLVEPWRRVDVGDPVCEIESAKASHEVRATVAGYVFYVLDPGSSVRVGEPLFYTFPSDNPGQALELDLADEASVSRTVSRKARELMKEHGLTPDDFPLHAAIGSAAVIAKLRELDKKPAPDEATSRLPDRIDDRDILIIGEPNLATLAVDIIESRKNSGLRALGFVNTTGGIPGGPSVAHFSLRQLPELRARALTKVFLCPQDSRQYEMLLERLDGMGFELISLIHQSAQVSNSASVGVGALIGAGVTVGPLAELGTYVRVLASASVAHHSKIEDFVVVSDGSHVGGNVTIGKRAELGIGVSVNKRIAIGAGALVVSGATVISDVPANSVHRLDGTLSMLQ